MSEAQSSTVSCLDVFLGIRHNSGIFVAITFLLIVKEYTHRKESFKFTFFQIILPLKSLNMIFALTMLKR